MKKILIILIFSFSVITLPQSESVLTESIDKLLGEDFFNSSQIAVDIYDLTAKKVIYQKNNKLLLHPASNMKVLTSAAGLLFLGPDYRFVTSVHYTGELVNNTIYGDLYIRGGGDPDFTAADIDSLIDQLKGMKITEITGDIIGDLSMKDSLFWGNGWMWDDDPSTDAPYLSPLNINDNAVAVHIVPSKPGSPAEIKIVPSTEYVQIINKTVTTAEGKGTGFYVNRDWLNRSNVITVSGRVEPLSDSLMPAYTERINIFKPELYFLTIFKEKLLAAGIKFSGSLRFEKLPETASYIAMHTRPYDTVLVNLNKVSDNLSAEMTLYAMGEKYYNPPATARKGLRMIDSMITLAGLNPQNYRLVDGSGVSHYNLVSAELLLEVLKYFYYNEPELYGKLYESFPSAGVDGTLRNRMKDTPAQNNVHAKTGTLSGVSSLSGYVRSASGNMIAFSILIQNHVRNTARAVSYQDRICRMLAEMK